MCNETTADVEIYETPKWNSSSPKILETDCNGLKNYQINNHRGIMVENHIPKQSIGRALPQMEFFLLTIWKACITFKHYCNPLILSKRTIRYSDHTTRMMKNHLIRWSVFLVCLLFARPVNAKSTSNPFYRKSLAVLVAVENYQYNDWDKMITPLADAKGLGKYLKSRDFIVDDFFDGKATKKAIKHYFEEVLPKKCGPQDRVVILLSGHFYYRKLSGNKTISFYVPYGGKNRRVGTMISFKLLKEWCNYLDAKHVFILVNGSWSNFPEKIVEKRFWKPRSKGYYRAASRKKTQQVLTAGYIGQSFSESGPSGTPYSLFGGSVISGLESGAADLDGDGIIGGTELAAYIRDKVYRDAQQYQKPVFGTMPGDGGGDIVFLTHAIGSKKSRSGTFAEARGTVAVAANISDATIYVDGKKRKKKTRAGKAVLLGVSIGKHTVKLSKKYYLNTSAGVFISDEKTSKIKLTLKEDPTLKIGYMVRIKSGRYIIGVKGKTRDSGPAHEVRVDDYFIGKHEVTNAEYLEFAKATGHPKPPCIEDENFSGANKPVVCVTWDDAMKYCKWKSRVTGKLYRLPTEAEWEIAARGDSNRKYPWGEAAPKEKNKYRANYAPKEDGYPCTASVRSLEAGQTPNKIFHMGGNVFEWCYDWYNSSYYTVSDYRNPTGPEDDSNEFKVIRGGSWLFDEESMECTSRGQIPPDEIKSDVGFRMVMIPKSP